jgi:hypothetical protein
LGVEELSEREEAMRKTIVLTEKQYEIVLEAIGLEEAHRIFERVGKAYAERGMDLLTAAHADKIVAVTHRHDRRITKRLYMLMFERFGREGIDAARKERRHLVDQLTAELPLPTEATVEAGAELVTKKFYQVIVMRPYVDATTAEVRYRRTRAGVRIAAEMAGVLPEVEIVFTVATDVDGYFDEVTTFKTYAEAEAAALALIEEVKTLQIQEIVGQVMKDKVEAQEELAAYKAAKEVA